MVHHLEKYQPQDLEQIINRVWKIRAVPSCLTAHLKNCFPQLQLFNHLLGDFYFIYFILYWLVLFNVTIILNKTFRETAVAFHVQRINSCWQTSSTSAVACIIFLMHLRCQWQLFIENYECSVYQGSPYHLKKICFERIKPDTIDSIS